MSQCTGLFIAIVEDDPELKQLLGVYFSENNTVAAYETAELCLDALKEGTDPVPSIVLLDLVLPGMSGLELARQLRKRFPNTKLLLMSGNITAETAEMGALAGVDSLLAKPFDIGILEYNIQRLLEGS